MDMVQVAWAAIGLLALTVVGMFVALFELNAQLGGRMDAGFQAVNTRLDATNARIDALGAQLQIHIERHAG